MAIIARIDIDGDELDSLRVIAAQTKTTVPKLIASALRTARVTKQAFQTKEVGK